MTLSEAIEAYEIASNDHLERRPRRPRWKSGTYSAHYKRLMYDVWEVQMRQWFAEIPLLEHFTKKKD